MLNQALEKIKTEMEANKDDAYIEAIGGFLIEYLEANPAAAEKIMVEGTTIAKSLEEMKKETRKKQKNGVGVLTDQTAFGIVLKYFGIEDASVIVEKKPAPVPEKKNVDFDVNLEDLL